MPLDTHRAYRILGLEPGASHEDIKSAYRDMAQVWHPDRFPAGSRLRDKAERNLTRINEAYGVLKDYQPPAQPAPRRMRESFADILGIGDLRETGAFPAPGPMIRRSIRILGLDQVVDRRSPGRVWWVIGALAVITAGTVAIVIRWRM